MIGCNIEDYKIRAIYFAYQTYSSFLNCSFLPKATGTYQEEIKLSAASHTLSFKGCFITSKGSTRISTSSVVTETTIANFESNTNSFDSYYSLNVSLKYLMPQTSLVNQVYGIYTQKTPYVTFDRNFGFNLQSASTWTANSATFAATGQTKFKTANTVSTTFTNATGGIEGQEMYLEIKDAFTTISHLSSGTGKFKLLKGSNLIAINGEVYHFIYDGTIWVEVGSENSIYSKLDSPTFTGTLTAPKIVSTNIIRLKNYTVSTLPVGVQGDTAFVTDALTPTYLGVLVGGGSVVTPVFYNGTAWVSH